jgi:hypothetical protein
MSSDSQKLRHLMLFKFYPFSILNLVKCMVFLDHCLAEKKKWFSLIILLFMFLVLKWRLGNVIIPSEFQHVHEMGGNLKIDFNEIGCDRHPTAIRMDCTDIKGSDL